MFEGYNEKTIDFIWGIRFNNERSWFTEHKQDYLDHLYTPTRELGEAVYRRLDEAFPYMKLELHVSRIYRDARRLHGNGPYKDHLWFSLRKEGKEWTQAPCFYFEVGPYGCVYGMGCYTGKASMMEAFRRDVREHPEKLRTLVRRFSAQSEYTLAGEEYKRRFTCPEALFEPWYNRKNVDLHAQRGFDDLTFSRALEDELVRGFTFLAPYYDYFVDLCYKCVKD